MARAQPSLADVAVLPIPAELDGLTTAELIVARVRGHVWRRLLWLQVLWEGALAPDGWAWTAHARDLRDDEKRFYRTKAAKTLSEGIAAVEAQLDREAGQYRRRVAELFALKPEEVDALDLCFALDAEAGLASQLAALFPDGVPDGETVVRQVFGHRHLAYDIFRPNSGLKVWRLVVAVAGNGAQGRYRIDRAVASFINGSLTLDEGLALIARVHAASGLVSYGGAGAAAAALKPLLEHGEKFRLRIDGRESDRPLDYAGTVAQGLGLRLLSLNLNGQADSGELMLRAERLALLGGFALHVEGLEWSRYPVGLAGAPVIFVTGDGERPALPGRIDRTLILAPPTAAEKLDFCLKVQKGGLGKGLKREALRQLCASPSLGYDDLYDLLSQAPGDLEAARQGLRRRVEGRGGEGGHVVVPGKGWGDIVLDDETLGRLQQIVFEARARARYGDHPNKTPLDYLRAGIPVMLHGAPGTGKTLAAEIMAGETGRNLYVADLAGLVSKYVGETAQNLRKLFETVKRSGDVLFIDEADSLFTRRTEVRDANDKHANADANYLLQLIENHPGFTLLATNRPADIDPAFFRRMRFNIEIGRPLASERLRMWRKTVGELLRREPVALDGLLQDLAGSLDMTPAQIKNAAVSAYFRALQAGRRIGRADLVDGIAYELGKEGRVLDERDARRFARGGAVVVEVLEKRGA